MTDADYRSMDAAIKRHTATVRREGQGTISLLYYSGHGAADANTKTNYLIPIDVADADDADLWNYSLNLNNIIDGLRAQAPASTVRRMPQRVEPHAQGQAGGRSSGGTKPTPTAQAYASLRVPGGPSKDVGRGGGHSRSRMLPVEASVTAGRSGAR